MQNGARSLTVVRFIAREMMPFSIVEKPAFRRMLQTFDSQYELPGRTYVSQTAIPQLYNSVKEKEKLDNAFDADASC